ncbi:MULTISPECIES: formyltransferase family protein [unclassified Cupriavidus]|uniref:methionyl-tRNA formyltransferase n=1 Tax=unclassified Cupriavidus TaxID=2640874 RepID=UPI001C008343|nr:MULTISPECIES: formyltransferase family protein [unclassified Cupriavidus]MCA3185297.1 hypothetical protein [Cupriavidus sp.]MCA3192836.1 hypothetical protein [Cupriavidus sp.]MCA3195037.1 hypothetical protein [Cupriavidus sp.]MCA3204007.1 hypothetical protein [Cupriavidus sp.]MCA3206178.1 hypothetical protein [Cupriavidus sp.]
MTAPTIGLLLLGTKGYAVLRAVKERSRAVIVCCVVGADPGVDDDHGDEIIAYCERHGLPYIARGQAAPAMAGADYVVAAGWRWLVTNVPEHRLIVFHDALLPRYRGFAPLVNAMLNREPAVGATALLGAREYDRGNILMQKPLAVSYPARIGDVIDAMSMVYADLVVELLDALEAGTVTVGEPQDESMASYSLWRDEDDYRVNWSASADDIAHFIRCVGAPYRGASARLKEKIVRIHGAEPLDDVRIENRAYGKVIFVQGTHPVVVCGSGLLRLMDVTDDQGVSLLPLKSFRSRFE